MWFTSALIKKIKEKIRSILIYKSISRFNNSGVTIISQNCIGGMWYHDLHERFNSPTINLFMPPPDFIKFCQKLEYYKGIELVECTEVESLKYARNLNFHWNRAFPIAKCGDIVLLGVHYSSFHELKDKWHTRFKRINAQNIRLIMVERDGCTFNDLYNFDRLPYKKVCFTSRQYKEILSCVVLPNSQVNEPFHKVTDLTSFTSFFSAKRFYDSWDFVDFLNK